MLACDSTMARSKSSIFLSCSEVCEGGVEFCTRSKALDIFHLLFSHHSFIDCVVQCCPRVVGTELAGRARGLRATEAAHAAVLIDEGIGDARGVSLSLAPRARLLLDAHAVLACDLSQRVEVHRARIEERLIDTISQELSPRRLVELVDREARSARPGTCTVDVVRESVGFEDSETHLAHDFVIRALEDPVLEAVLASRVPGDKIDVRDSDVRVGIPTLGVEMNHDITRTVRCNLFRQRISSVSDDLRRCRIVRVELVSRERLDHHERLILTTTPSEH
jgi:hypothetical protein